MDRHHLLAWAPWLAAIAVGLLAAGAIYGLAYADQQRDHRVEGGEQRTLTVGDDEHLARNLTWSLRLDLPAEPEHYRLRVSLPYEVDVDPPTGNNSRTHATVRLNGETVHEHVQHPGYGGVEQTLPGALESEAFRRGPNELRAELAIRHDPDLEGANEIRAGPLVAEARALDRDGDGVADAHQPIAGLHTGLLAAFGGSLAAVSAGLMARRRWRR